MQYFSTVYRGEGYIVNYEKASSALKAKLSKKKCLHKTYDIYFIPIGETLGFVGRANQLLNIPCLPISQGVLKKAGDYYYYTDNHSIFAISTYSKYVKLHKEFYPSLTLFEPTGELEQLVDNAFLAEYIFSSIETDK